MADKQHSIAVTDEDIVAAYNSCRNLLGHTDSPRELELCYIREVLAANTTDLEMLSLNWLRNQIVRLRKGDKLEKQLTYKGI